MKEMSQVLIKNLVRQLHEIQEGSLWFDQCFKEKLYGLSDENAFTRPIPQMHSVAEHVSHMLEWRKECMRRFEGFKYDLMHSPDDWKGNEALRKMGWPALQEAFYNSQLELIQKISSQDDRFLETNFLDTAYNFHYLMEGIIHHDIYHLGQIGLTIKLLRSESIV